MLYPKTKALKMPQSALFIQKAVTRDNNKEDLAGAVGNDVKSADQTRDITPKQDSSRDTTSLPSFKSTLDCLSRLYIAHAWTM